MANAASASPGSARHLPAARADHLEARAHAAGRQQPLSAPSRWRVALAGLDAISRLARSTMPRRAQEFGLRHRAVAGEMRDWAAEPCASAFEIDVHRSGPPRPGSTADARTDARRTACSVSPGRGVVCVRSL